MVNDPNTIKFLCSPNDHDLVQYVVGSTHRDRHTLDLLITRSNARAPVPVVEEPKLFGSDHSFISAMLDLQYDDDKPVTKTVELWHNFNQNSFTNDFLHLKLIVDPPSDAMTLFECYNQTLKSLVDIYEPLATAPWYDACCINVKANNLRLEGFYRTRRMPASLDDWRSQVPVILHAGAVPRILDQCDHQQPHQL